MAVFGLRPEDLREVYTKKNGEEIWTDYRKSKGGRKGEVTQPRKLMPIWVLDTDGTPKEWNYTLKNRVAAGESLPPLKIRSSRRGDWYLFKKTKDMADIKSRSQARTREFNVV